MKKKILSALTTALVVGAASTTFAAAPFADVPAGHWAYDAVASLAAEGVVNGYNGSEFKGDQTMSRYEMAQIVYKAMMNPNLSAAGKQNVGKLSSEFADELAKLGVQVNIVITRVDALDQKVNALDTKVADIKKATSWVENVKLGGQIRYDYVRKNSMKGDRVTSRSQRAQRLIFRLTPTMKINEKWTGHMRYDMSLSMNSGMNSSSGTGSGAYRENYQTMDQLYADATYGKTKITLGRFGAYDASSHGMILDDNVSGIQVEAPIGGGFRYVAAIGRYSYDPNRTVNAAGYPGVTQKVGDEFATYKDSCDYAQLDLLYKNKDFGFGVGVKNFRSHDMFHYVEDAKNNGDRTGEWSYTDPDNTKHNFAGDTMRTLSAGFDYKFGGGKKLQVVGDYGYLLKGGDNMDTAHKTSYSVQLNYGGVDVKKPGSYKLYVAYRQLSHANTMVPTYQNSLYSWQKGWDFGTQFAPAKNVRASLCYFWGTNYGNQTDQQRLFGRLELMF